MKVKRSLRKGKTTNVDDNDDDYDDSFIQRKRPWSQKKTFSREGKKKGEGRHGPVASNLRYFVSTYV